MLPPGADVPTFPLSDGRLEQRQTIKVHAVATLGELLKTLVIDNLKAAVLHPDWFDSD